MQHGERRDDAAQPVMLTTFQIAVIANALMSTASGMQTMVKKLRRDFKQKEAAEMVAHMGEVNAALAVVKAALPSAGEAVQL